MLVELRSNRQHRIERRKRLLRDESDLAAKQRAAFLRVHRDQIDTVEFEAAAAHGKRRRQQLRYGASDHGLAGTGLAHKAEHLPGLQRKRQVAQNGNALAIEGGGYRQIPRLQNHAKGFSLRMTLSQDRFPLFGVMRAASR